MTVRTVLSTLEKREDMAFLDWNIVGDSEFDPWVIKMYLGTNMMRPAVKDFKRYGWPKGSDVEVRRYTVDEDGIMMYV